MSHESWRFLEKLQQRWHASFFDDEFPVTIIVASEGDEESGCVGMFVQGSAGEKNGDLFLDEAEDGLVGGDGREAEVLVVALVGGGIDAEVRGTLVEVVAVPGGLAEEARQLLSFGFQLQTFLSEILGLFRKLRNLVRHLYRARQDLLDDARHVCSGPSLGDFGLINDWIILLEIIVPVLNQRLLWRAWVDLWDMEGRG